MADFISALSGLTWPGAFALATICVAVVGVAYLYYKLLS